MKLLLSSLKRPSMMLQILALTLFASCSGADLASPGLSSITVTLSATLTVGQVTQASAILTDMSGGLYVTAQGETVVWISSDSKVATVSTSGVVTALSAGVTNITATLLGKTGSSSLIVASVAPAPVATVSLTLLPSSVVVNQTALAVPTLRDANNAILTDRSLTFSTSDPTVAVISSTGVITALKAGVTTITATSEGIFGSSTLVVAEVAAPALKSVRVTLIATLTVGQTTQASAILTDMSDGPYVKTQGDTVLWISSDSKVATVSTSGVVTALGAGVTNITATLFDKSGSSSLAVSVAPAPVATVSLTLLPSSVVVSQTALAVPTVRDANSAILTGRSLTFVTNDPTVAVISPTGVITGRAVGVTVVTATSEGKAGIALMTVTANVLPAPVATVSVSIGSPNLTVGQTTPATATLRDAVGAALSGRTIAWSSSNTSVATASSSGLVTAVAAGAANIVATSEGKSGSASITVVSVLPAIDPNEPVFSATTQKLLFQDEFDYTTFADANANGWRGTDGANVSDTRFTTDPLGANQIIAPGFDGTGHAMRLVYNGVETNTGTNQEARSWGRLQSDTVAAKPGRAFYISYYFRMTPGGGFKLDQDPAHIIKVKWLELWNTPGSDRAQFNTSYSTCINDVPFVGAGGSGTLFEFYGSGSSTSKCLAGQVRGPFAFAGAGQWHRATHKYMTKSVPGARDGVAQMWVDGVLIVNVNVADCNVPVPGGVGGQAWCAAADLDGMFSQETVTRITLGSVQTAALWPFAIDYDRMKIWRD